MIPGVLALIITTATPILAGKCRWANDGDFVCTGNSTYSICSGRSVSPNLQNCPDKYECHSEPGQTYSLGCKGPAELTTAETIGFSFATIAFIIVVGFAIAVAWRMQFAITWIKKQVKREERLLGGDVVDESSGAIRLLEFLVVKEE
ncbi:UNVERIFIED_CONTAM: hypothetical protein HDU68_000729 [Siphonaria sp. JEL0065]|nr:hypothetical protein HDU68_000729 [Siphonaria sp. JEL0065]